MEKGRAPWRLLTVVPLRDHGGSGDGEKWMDIKYIFEVESTAPSDSNIRFCDGKIDKIGRNVGSKVLHVCL